MSALPIFSYNKSDSTSIVRLPKSLIIALLASLFSISFVLSDYWNIPANNKTKLIILSITIMLGFFWSLNSAGDLTVKIKLKPSLVIIVVVIVLIAINLAALNSSIPWRGDEDHHINKVLHLMERVPSRILFGFFVIWLIILYLSLHKPNLAIIVGCLFLLLLIIILFNNEPIASLRYPFINYWFIFIPPKIFSFFFSPNQEFLFRIVPLTSVILLSLFFLKNLPLNNKLISLVWALSIGFMPIIFYYSSILYLEFPAILLMTFVCFNIEDLIQSDIKIIKKLPSWYALLLVGLIKETDLPFIFCFILVRLIYRMWITSIANHALAAKDNKQGQTFLPIIKSELLVAFSTLTPSIFYLVLRSSFSSYRQYSPTIHNLVNFQLYAVYFRSFIEQFGLFFLFFLIGSYILLKKKKHKSLGFLFLLVLFYTIFFLLDENIYVGYSRFNLLFLPPILTASYYFIISIFNNRKMSLILSVTTILISLIISPVNIDGSKEPLWGNYLTDTSEHYFPTNEALTWIKETYPEDNLLVGGLYYPYYFDFYFDKLQWQPDEFETYYSDIEEFNDEKKMSKLLELAEQHDFDHVLFFAINSELPEFEHSYYKQEATFSNLSHKLIYLSKSSNGELK